MRLAPLTLVSILLAAAPGCRSELVPARALPRYTPEAALLLDDAFGSAVVDGDPVIIDDEIWAARVQSARAVVPALVATVSLDSMTGQAGQVSITFGVLGPPLAGSLDSGTIEVEVPSGSPSYHLVRTRRDAISGRRLLLFIGWFDEGGERTPHWHAEPDEPATREAVARVLSRE
jgi:hypothetical protein